MQTEKQANRQKPQTKDPTVLIFLKIALLLV